MRAGHPAFLGSRPDLLSSNLLRLPDRSGLRRLAEEVVQLTGAHGGDQRVEERRQLLLRADDDAGLPLLELDGLGPPNLTDMTS